MPRKKREISPTNLYHVIYRGVNRQQIFGSKSDYSLYKRILKEAAEEIDCRIHAYAIMGNHVHLLVEAGEKELSSLMQRVSGKFAQTYNWLYGRTGHLAQDRFGSVPILDERQFLTVFRYILRNPLKAGMENRMGQYIWTSFGAYIGKDDGITCTEKINGYFNTTLEMLQYLGAENDDVCWDVDPGYRTATEMAETRAQFMMRREFACTNASEFQNMNLDRQHACLMRLMETGASVTSISRLTGISRKIICKYTV